MLFRHLHESGSEEKKDTEAHGENAEERKDYRQNKNFEIKTFPDKSHGLISQDDEETTLLSRTGSGDGRRCEAREEKISISIYYLNYRAIILHVNIGKRITQGG
jgi:hypothetical protein